MHYLSMNNDFYGKNVEHKREIEKLNGKFSNN